MTKSGTNELRGNALLLLPRREPERQEPLREVRRLRQPGRPREGAVQPAAVGSARSAVPCVKDRTFFFLRSSRPDIDDNRLRDHRPDAAAGAARGGVPGGAGQRARTQFKNTEFLGKVDHQWSPTTSFVVRGNYADIEREHRRLRRHRGPEPRHRAAPDRLVASRRRADRHPLVAAGSTSCACSSRTRTRRSSRSIPSAAARASDDQGGPTLEVTGVASVGRQRFTPHLRLNSASQFMDTISYLGGNSPDQGRRRIQPHRSPRTTPLPLHFGGRYIFSAIPALGVPRLSTACRGNPGGVCAGIRESRLPGIRLPGPVGLRAGRMEARPAGREAGCDISASSGRTSRIASPMPAAARSAIRLPQRRQQRCAASRRRLRPDRRRTNTVHGSYGMFYDNIDQRSCSMSDAWSTARPRRPHARAGCAARVNGLEGARPSAHRRPGDGAARRLVSVTVAIMPEPALKNSYTHQASIGVDRLLGSDLPSASTASSCAASISLARSTTTRSCRRRSARAGVRTTCRARSIRRRHASTGTSRVRRRRSFSTPRLARSWYKGLTLSLTKRLSRELSVPRFRTRSRRPRTPRPTYQSNFIVQNNGFGRNPSDRFGLPLGFDPEYRAGAGDTRSASPVRVVGCLHLASRDSAVGHLHGGVGPAVHAAGRRRPER